MKSAFGPISCSDPLTRMSEAEIRLPRQHRRVIRCTIGHGTLCRNNHGSGFALDETNPRQYRSSRWEQPLRGGKKEETTVSHSSDQPSMGVWSRIRKVAAIAMIALVAANLFGCEVDTWLFDPSKPGRFEFYPTTIPVLDRIDVIEPQEETWSRATTPTSEDLLPRELAYYIYPGDMLTLGIFELYQPSQWATVSRQVDAGGYYRVPELG